MSLAVLKRKSERFRNAPVSSTAAGFSLNGTLRNTTGFRLLSGTTRTPFKGPLPRGHGTGPLNGKYPLIISNTGSTVGINDSSIVKRSSVSDATMRDLKYRWIRGGTYPRVWHKEIASAHVETRTQRAYIKMISEEGVPGARGRKGGAAFKIPGAALDACGRNAVPPIPAPGTAECACLRKVGSESAIKHLRIRITTKPGQIVVSQGQYLTLGGVGRRNCLPTPPQMQPFPFPMAHNGCDVNYLRWQDAQAAGRLPANFVG
jgi:hypothetical protein